MIFFSSQNPKAEHVFLNVFQVLKTGNKMESC
jgi:hypothetical protein